MEMLLGLCCSGLAVSWEFGALSAILPCLGRSWVTPNHTDTTSSVP